MAKTDAAERGLRADIRVMGVGGGGGNAVETMWKRGVGGVRFVTVNTDAQALAASSVETKIQLGANLTKGLGAGANPEVGRRAAIESYEDIVKNLKGADMVFITAGMGGGTGTGGIAVAAEAARESGALTVGVVTYPFLFEGRKRRRNAQKGIQDLKNYVDTLIVIHNDKLLTLSDDKTPLAETFQKTDNILFQAVQGIAGLISVKGLINLDFADVKTVMQNKGMALMGIGLGEGRNRAADAVSQAVSSPLLENISIKGATGIIANVTGGPDLSLMEVNQAISLLTDEADEDAEIIVGAAINEEQKDSLTLTVIATGFEEKVKRAADPLLNPAGGTPFSSGLSGKVFLKDSLSSFSAGGKGFSENGGAAASSTAASAGATTSGAEAPRSSDAQKTTGPEGENEKRESVVAPSSDGGGGAESLLLKNTFSVGNHDKNKNADAHNNRGKSAEKEEGGKAALSESDFTSAEEREAAPLSSTAHLASSAEEAGGGKTEASEDGDTSLEAKAPSSLTADGAGTSALLAETGTGTEAESGAEDSAEEEKTALQNTGGPDSIEGADALSKRKEDMTPRELLLSKIQEYKNKQAALKQEGKQLPLEEAEGEEPLSDNEGLLFETDVQVSSDQN